MRKKNSTKEKGVNKWKMDEELHKSKRKRENYEREEKKEEERILKM